MPGIGDVIVGLTPGREHETHALTNFNRGRFNIGTQGIMEDGRKFRYCIQPTGATVLVRGDWQQAQINTANHIGLTPVAALVGSLTVTVALGATAVLANEYANGYLHINQGAAGGAYYLIKEHPAAALSTNLVLTLFTGVVTTAIPATAASADLIHNKFWNPIIGPVTKTQAPIGVACIAIAAGFAGWVQTTGPAAVLTQGALVAGNPCCTSTSVAGAVAAYAAAGAATEGEVGEVMRNGGNGLWSLIDLKLDA